MDGNGPLAPELAASYPATIVPDWQAARQRAKSKETSTQVSLVHGTVASLFS